MKKLLLLVFVLLNVQAYAAVGKHNLSVKVGGGLSVSQLKPLDKIYGQTVPGELVQFLSEDMLGGMFEVNLGYQFFSVTPSSFVHGFNMLLGFGMNFDTLRSAAGLDIIYFQGSHINYNRMNVSLSSTYSVGHQFSNAKLMFDILGFNLSFGRFELDVKNSITGQKMTSALGGYFGVGINLPLGIQYVMNNGFVIGFSHSLSFLLPAYSNAQGQNLLESFSVNPYDSKQRIYNYFNYSLVFSIGFMFGK